MDLSVGDCAITHKTYNPNPHHPANGSGSGYPNPQVGYGLGLKIRPEPALCVWRWNKNGWTRGDVMQEWFRMFYRYIGVTGLYIST